MNTQLYRFTPADVALYAHTRVGEQRFGDAVALLSAQLPLADALQQAKANGCRFALLGIPEDIGPRGNLGRGGAHTGWPALLKRLLNTPVNQFAGHDKLLLVGHIVTDDLQTRAENANTETLRALCAELDQRVSPVIAQIVAAGLEPIVIGGGHNNAYPIIAGHHQALGKAISVINLDPHADFRELEGRHSGNGFSYATQQGLLYHYEVLALHEFKNNQVILDRLAAHNFPYVSYQDLYLRERVAFKSAVQQAKQRLLECNTAIGIEVDIDVFSHVPVSAANSSGISLQLGEYYVYQLAQQQRECYLHLAEAAPCLHPAGLAQGELEAGQALTALVLAYLQGRQEQ